MHDGVYHDRLCAKHGVLKVNDAFTARIRNAGAAWLAASTHLQTSFSAKIEDQIDGQFHVVKAGVFQIVP